MKEKEDLETEIGSIRSTLVSLRKKKREAKEKMKGATGEKESFPVYSMPTIPHSLVWFQKK